MSNKWFDFGYEDGCNNSWGYGDWLVSARHCYEIRLTTERAKKSIASYRQYLKGFLSIQKNARKHHPKNQP